LAKASGPPADPRADPSERNSRSFQDWIVGELARREATRVAAKAVQVAAGPYILFVTQNGLIKRTKLQAFARPRPSGLELWQTLPPRRSMIGAAV